MDRSGPDYENIEWFKDPPPIPKSLSPSMQSSASSPPEPVPEVTTRNEALTYAITVAPAILYERFRQFGQLGILGWLDEFSELVDDFQALAFEGKMFTTTRDRALSTCKHILKLEIEVKMQLVVLYMSSQIARLRRILAEDQDFYDYPEPSFPLPPI